jgi:aminoglycoside phosphotransferase (APT) family kinase protein
VVRVPRHDAARAALEREARLLPVLGAHGVPFLPLEVAAVRGAGGAVVAVAHRYIAGEALTRTRLAAIRGSARGGLARDIARFLGALHAVPPEAARAAGVREPAPWADVYAPLIDEVRPHLGPATLAGLARLARRFERDADRQRRARRLVHGDIAGAHLLVDHAGALAGVIDFGAAMLSDPALDFAGLLNDGPRSFLARVLAQYPLAVDGGALARAGGYIALAPLYAVREGAARGDAALLARARRQLAARVSRAAG